MIMYPKIRHPKAKSQALALLFLEKLIKEQNLIVNGVIPILPVMSAGTSDKVMVNLPGQQTVMQILVHIQKEIRFTTVDNDSKSPFSILSI